MSLYKAGDHERVVPLQNIDIEGEEYRTSWRRDYARLIHSPAFRRLDGKTQLFPSHESEFFRNRLTHTLEVAQIAKSIALRLNCTDAFFRQHPLDTDLVETASLAHDLGHPPFGHNGEEALDECMRDAGGFEGNAQSLRIISKLEKRQTRSATDEPMPIKDGIDQRVGLNLSYRTMAAILKYDNEIPREGKKRKKLDRTRPVKGYYYTEAALVKAIKEHVGVPETKQGFRTIECSIMDVADDIAYSTYDLEDAFKAGFLTPLSMLSKEKALLESVAETVTERLKRYYPELEKNQTNFSAADVQETVFILFKQLFEGYDDCFENAQNGTETAPTVALMASQVEAISKKIASEGYYRIRVTSDLVGKFVNSVKVTVNQNFPAFSTVKLEVEVFKQVEVLKNFTFQALIMSSMLKNAEHRGKDIVQSIFKALSTDEGHMLMPDDFRKNYDLLVDPHERKRVICDFIAGMTDRYAVRFYSRIYGTSPESIYSPL